MILKNAQLTIQMDRLNNSGRESRKRQKLLQVQVRSLVEERADFLAQLQDQHREIIALKKRLGIAEKENEDLSKFPVNVFGEFKEFEVVMITRFFAGRR